MALKEFLARRFPFAIRAKRFLLAWRDHLSPLRATYAQAGEDAHIARRLADIDLTNGIYVDVGANQPTRISNTYLFYRRGYHGVAVEPDRSIEWLFRRFRPRDVYVPVGCDDTPGVAAFHYASASVLSSFEPMDRPLKTEYVPVLTLDQILRQIPFRFIFLLSIDVEGLDVRVLRGAANSLARTLLVSVEENEPDPEVAEILTQAGFDFDQRVGCNGIYIRRGFPRIPA